MGLKGIIVLFLKKELAEAAAEIRNADASLTTIIGQLKSERVWSGNDADAFQRDWNDQIHNPLIGSAMSLDNTDFKPHS